MQRDLSIRLVTVNGYPDHFYGATIMHDIKPEEKYTVVLNDDRDDLRKTATFLHEALHIYHQDHISHDDEERIEAERRTELLQILKILTDEEE